MSSTATGSRAVSGGRQQVLHKWTDGDGGAAVRAFFDEFNDRHADVAVEGVLSDNLGLTVKSRILREDPPEFWMGWPGATLDPYDDAGVLGDLTPLWEDDDWESAFAPGVRDVALRDGSYVAVPTNVHRLNNLFYNVELVEAAGVDPARVADPRELVEVLDQLRDELDVVAMAQSMRQPRTVLQTMEAILLGQFGVDVFEAVTDGRAAAHRTEIAETLAVFESLADLAEENLIFVDFVEAAERFARGEAATLAQGDWMASVLMDREGFEYGRDWDQVPFPGGEDAYQVVMDGVMATRAADLDGDARPFLEFAVSTRGQTVYNSPKGSIPARSDVDLSVFPAFLRDQHADFNQSRAQPPTIAHGLAVSPDQHVEIESAVANFIQEWDVAATADALVAAFDG